MDDYVEIAKFALQVLQLVSIVGVGIYTWIVNRTKANKDAIEEVRAALNVLASEHKQLETEVAAMPGHEEIALLHEKINDVSSGVSHIRGELTGIGRTSSQILEVMLRNRGAE